MQGSDQQSYEQGRRVRTHTPAHSTARFAYLPVSTIADGVSGQRHHRLSIPLPRALVILVEKSLVPLSTSNRNQETRCCRAAGLWFGISRKLTRRQLLTAGRVLGCVHISYPWRVHRGLFHDLYVKVGFRDDTSYLAAHYGGGISRQAASVTAKKVSSSRGATSAHSTLDLTAKSIPSTSNTHTTPSLHTPTRKRSNVDAGRGRALQAGARRTGEAAALVRPTLSEQLASIGKAAEDITA